MLDKLSAYLTAHPLRHCAEQIHLKNPEVQAAAKFRQDMSESPEQWVLVTPEQAGFVRVRWWRFVGDLATHP